MNLPVVNIGNANHPAYLPLKVCAVLAQASKMKLNPNETKIMQRFAVRTPDRNATDIKDEGFRTLGLGSRNQRLVILCTGDGRFEANANRSNSVWAWSKTLSQSKDVPYSFRNSCSRVELLKKRGSDPSGISTASNLWRQNLWKIGPA